MPPPLRKTLTKLNISKTTYPPPLLLARARGSSDKSNMSELLSYSDIDTILTRYPTGFMDIISIPKTSENYRLLYNTRSTYRVTTLLGTRHDHPSKAATRTQEM